MAMSVPTLRGRLRLTVVGANGLYNADWMLMNKSDPYCIVWYGRARLLRTQSLPENLNPIWNADVVENVCGRANELIFEVYDSNKIKDVKLGTVSLPVTKLHGSRYGKVHCLDLDPQGSIDIKYEYREISDDGVLDVPYVYFPAHANNRVTPFNCAICPTGHVPNVRTAAGTVFAYSYWHHLYEQLHDAKRFIYIVGWSVWTKLKLKRDGTDEESLGDLLTRRANEGVDVRILVWDEYVSFGDKVHSSFASDGLLSTHDEETVQFFKNTKVKCKKLSRPKDMSDPSWSDYIKDVVYTHHQKSVCLDDHDRKVAFVGGLDLCDGRWDTPDHPLFGLTLRREHAEDYHQCMVAGTSVGTGPRQPWQDVAARLEGPVAEDVIRNFEERWRKQVDEGDSTNSPHAGVLAEIASARIDPVDCFGRCMGLSKLFSSSVPHEDEAQDAYKPRKITRLRPKIDAADARLHHWNVQLFRSIDQLCAKFDDNPNLQRKRANCFDKSIQEAYVHQIRKAQHFIYIENQYFMGSSHLWGNPKQGCDNLVPAEIAYTVARKIHRGEPFHVYINIPMWPEGIPEAKASQEILHWQHQTVTMMYQIVWDALEETGVRGNPLDYLSFYTLVKRERQSGSYAKPTPGTSGELMYKHGRAPIYIHSKHMVVDDRYMIMGSANLNERSLSGTRDTEIAFGAYQPSFCGGQDGQKLGAVQGFRMQLWAAHLGIKDASELEAYRSPGTIEVARRVRRRACEHWDQYTGHHPVDISGQLVPYPYKVDREKGKVTVEGRYQHFPDTKAEIIGRNVRGMLNLITM